MNVVAKFCTNCGKEINENQDICLNCGSFIEKDNHYSNPVSNDTGSLGWAFLGFFVPLVGLILFLAWKNEKPKTAKKAGVGALIRVIITVVLYLVIIILWTVLATNMRGWTQETFSEPNTNSYYNYYE